MKARGRQINVATAYGGQTSIRRDPKVGTRNYNPTRPLLFLQDNQLSMSFTFFKLSKMTVA